MKGSEDGSGNAVADLKAGFGAALSSAAEVGGNFQRVTQPADPERVVPVPGNSRWEDEAAYWRNRALLKESVSGEPVADLEALRAEVERSAELKAEVEQGDGFYWMNRARAAEADVGDRKAVERDRDYWMRRARAAEERLRLVSAHFVEVGEILSGIVVRQDEASEADNG